MYTINLYLEHPQEHNTVTLYSSLRPDQINVLVVGFPDPNYPESEFLLKKNVSDDQSQKMFMSDDMLFYFHLKSPRRPI